MKKTIVPLATGTCLFLGVLALSNASAEQDKKGKDEAAVREIVLNAVSPVKYTNALQPVKITNAEELAKAVRNQDPKNFDFATQQCLLFAWKSSGGDRMSFKVEDGKEGPVVVFNLSPGMTDDLRSHARLYIIPRTATWRFTVK